MLSVCISFCRSKTVPFHMVIICIEFKENTKLRHVSQLFHRIICQSCFHSSITKHFVCQTALADRCGRHQIFKSDLYTVFMNSCLRCIGRCISLFAPEIFVRYIHTCDFPLCIAHWHQVSAVVICRCSPEIRLRDRLDHLSSCIFIRNQSSVKY